MREAGELALHPHELAGVFQRLFLGVLNVHANEVTEIFRTGDVTVFRGGLRVEFEDFLGVIDRGVQRDVGIALLRGPDDGFFRQHAGDPDPRIWFLQRNGPGIDDAVLVVGAFPAERAGFGPDFLDQVVRLDEALAVEGGVDAGGQLLLPAAAHEAGDQAAFGDHVDHGQFLGHADRVVTQRQRVAEDDDLYPLGGGGEDGGENVGFRLHAEWRVVMLVEHDAVGAAVLGEDVVFQVFVIQPAAGDRIVVAVGEVQRGGAEVEAGLGVVGGHRLLGEIHDMHDGGPPSGGVDEVGDEFGNLGGFFHFGEVAAIGDGGHRRVA